MFGIDHKTATGSRGRHTHALSWDETGRIVLSYLTLPSAANDVPDAATHDASACTGHTPLIDAALSETPAVSKGRDMGESVELAGHSGAVKGVHLLHDGTHHLDPLMFATLYCYDCIQLRTVVVVVPS